MTLARIVLIKLKPEHSDAEGREALALAVKSALTGESDIRALHVELPADEDAERSWDVALRLEVESQVALERLAARERYRAIFERELPARAVVVKAWSFVPG